MTMALALNLAPALTAAMTGFVSGVLLSIPIGPINLTILHEGARRGFLWAALIGLGATVMEVIYCAVACVHGVHIIWQMAHVQTLP